MKIVTTGVDVNGPHGRLLEPTSLRASSKRTLLVAGPPRSGRTALALILAGRLRPARGLVRVDDRAADENLRDRVAVVDSPAITEPEGSIPLGDVVGEGLGLAGLRSGRRAVLSVLEARGLAARRAERFENLTAEERTRVLLDLACASASTEAVILDCPDRHGGDPRGWYAPALHTARAGYAVVVMCAEHSPRELEVDAARIGTDNDPETGTPAPPTQTPATTSL